MISPVMRSFNGPACLLWVALTATSCGALAQFAGGGGEAGGDLTKFPKELKNLPAMHLANPTHAQMLAVARAGSRSVAVGDHGTVILSDDDGNTWRQAKDVPTRVLLTSVCFIDDKQGWAVGHWGEILHTEDGGETWKLQRTDTSVDQPLFSVYFSDGGQTWSLIKTGNKGSFWAGLALADNSVLVAGLNGKIWRSTNAGKTWSELTSGVTASITDLTLSPDGSVIGVGLEGAVINSKDGVNFTASPRPDREPLTAALATARGGVELFSKDGVVGVK